MNCHEITPNVTLSICSMGSAFLCRWSQMPQAHINFVYKLDGDIREVDIFNLAPTLLSLGELIQKATKRLTRTGQILELT